MVLDLVVACAAFLQFIANYSEHLARFAAAVVFCQLGDMHAVQAGLPGIACQLLVT